MTEVLGVVGVRRRKKEDSPKQKQDESDKTGSAGDPEPVQASPVEGTLLTRRGQRAKA